MRFSNRQSWIYLSFVLPDSQSNNNWQPNLYFGFFMKLTHLSLVQYWFIQSYRQVLYTGLSLHETSLIMGIKSKSIYEGGLKSYNGWGSDGLGKLIPKFYANAKVHSSLWISIVWKSVKIDIKVLPTLICTKPYAIPGTSFFCFFRTTDIRTDRSDLLVSVLATETKPIPRSAISVAASTLMPTSASRRMNSRKGDACATSFMKRTLNWKRWIFFLLTCGLMQESNQGANKWKNHVASFFTVK